MLAQENITDLPTVSTIVGIITRFCNSNDWIGVFIPVTTVPEANIEKCSLPYICILVSGISEENGRKAYPSSVRYPFI